MTPQETETLSEDWIQEQKDIIENNGGIGWEGDSLQTMMEDSERRYEETGHYQGLTQEELPLKTSKRTTYEQLFSQLRGGLVNARDTSKDVSASPIVEQEGECCFAVYTPEGDAVAMSTGILVHVHTMSDTIKYMVKHNYEENPGIEPGDIFCNNDPEVGTVHNTDVQTLMPIFWEGEVVAWAAGVTHVIEGGTPQGGSIAHSASRRWGDGYINSARKVGSDFELHEDWKREASNSVRTPDFWQLDEGCRVNGCLMIRDLVHRLIRNQGTGTWKKFTREAIEDVRRGFKRTIKTRLVPGTYRTTNQAAMPDEDQHKTHPEGEHNYMLNIRLETEITADGHLEFDLTGANRWGWHACNGTPSAMQGGLWVAMTETLIAGDKVNDGAFFACDFHFPRGTWVNPQNTEVAHAWAWQGPMPTWSGLWHQLSHAYMARGFLEEINAGNPCMGNPLQGGGLNQYGQPHATTNFEIAASGFGALAVTDGPDYMGPVWNPEGDMGDCEIWEMTEPNVFLGRNVKPNSAGPGRFRGGAGFESLRMIWRAKRWYMSNLDIGAGLVFTDDGLFGGYPSANIYSLSVHDSDLKDRFDEHKPVPHGDLDPQSPSFESGVEGDMNRNNQCWGMDSKFEDYDLYLNVQKGGPGYGDPLERNPESVLVDVEENYLLPRFAETTYGVVLEGGEDGYSVDVDATKKLRDSKRQERSEARPVEDWLEEKKNQIEDQQASDVVKKTYKSSMKMSDEFADWFRSFWDLSSDWEPELSEEEERELQERLDTPERPIWDQDKITMYNM